MFLWKMLPIMKQQNHLYDHSERSEVEDQFNAYTDVAIDVHTEYTLIGRE